MACIHKKAIFLAIIQHFSFAIDMYVFGHLDSALIIIIIAVSHTGIPGVKEKKHTETTEDKD